MSTSTEATPSPQEGGDAVEVGPYRVDAKFDSATMWWQIQVNQFSICVPHQNGVGTWNGIPVSKEAVPHHIQREYPQYADEIIQAISRITGGAL